MSPTASRACAETSRGRSWSDEDPERGRPALAAGRRDRRRGGRGVDPARRPGGAARASADVAFAGFESPVGSGWVAATDRGIVSIALPNRDRDEFLADLAAGVSPRVLEAPGRLDGPRRQLDEYFTGARRRFELELDWRLVHSDFYSRVLHETARLPTASPRATARSRPPPATPAPTAPPARPSRRTRSRSSSPVIGSCGPAACWATTAAARSSSAGFSARGRDRVTPTSAAVASP